MKRHIIRIDEDKCTGCGLCIPNCPEGALQVIDNKARLVSDLFCDGLGACIGYCPEGAITVEEREAEPYDEARVMENIMRSGPSVVGAHLRHLRDHGQNELLMEALGVLKRKGMKPPEGWQHAPREADAVQTSRCGCPGASTVDFRESVSASGPKGPAGAPEGSPAAGTSPDVTVRAGSASSELRQWPVQLQLLNPHAPYFKDADLLVAADCVPFANPDFHKRFLKGKILVVFCPKLDDVGDLYLDKLTEILKHNSIKSVTVVHMEVPCCFGTDRIVEEALRRSGKKLKVSDYTVSMRGEVI